MNIWSRIADALSALAQGESLSTVFDSLSAPPERSIGFTIAVISLGAKMAKADGQVTRDEVSAFREVFHISPSEEGNAAKVFNMARTDTAGFELYASRIRRMFGADHEALHDVIEGLFHIAVADGDYHPAENLFLERVAEIFEMEQHVFRRLRTQFVPDAVPDPYDVLGVEPTATPAEIRASWRRLVRETHPDRVIARGMPMEAVKLAEKRLVAINQAWEILQSKAA
jgi:DnaJ like chaperone protein